MTTQWKTNMTAQRLNTPEEEAARLNLSSRTMAKARSTGSPNIPYIKIGRTVRYDPVAVDAWLNEHSHNITRGFIQ
jgi:hypothetical protein